MIGGGGGQGTIGEIILTSNSASPFVVDSTGTPANGIIGSVVSSGVSGYQYGIESTNGAAGAIIINNFGSGGLAINKPGNLLADGGLGVVALTASSAINTASPLQLPVNAAAVGPITFGSGTLSVDGPSGVGGENFNGGSVLISGQTVTPAGSLVICRAIACEWWPYQYSGDSKCGEFNHQLIRTAVFANGGTPAQYALPPMGGTVSVAAGGNLTVDTNYLSTYATGSNASGGQVNLTAGTATGGGLLAVAGNLDVSGTVQVMPAR